MYGTNVLVIQRGEVNLKLHLINLMTEKTMKAH
jgi:hypothetical protein